MNTKPAAVHVRPRRQEPDATRDPAASDPFVNLSIKVNKAQRLHWLIESKKQGTSLTKAITDALNARFGETADI